MARPIDSPVVESDVKLELPLLLFESAELLLLA
jgi:hypothetical protein